MQYKKKVHLFETNIECHRRYKELLKEATFWNSSGQYWLGRQTEILAEQLLNEDKSVVNNIIKTEDNFCKTKKLIN